MPIPCPTKVTCPNFDGNPTINTSSEAPDLLTFFGEAFGPFKKPPLGTTWTALTDYTTCESTVSQASADACAQGTSSGGAEATWVPPAQQPLPVRNTFFNTDQKGTAFCADTTPYVFDVAPGQFFAGSQSAANSAAKTYARQQAQIHLLCLSDLPDFICLGAAVNLQVIASSRFIGAIPGANVWQTSTLPDGLTMNNPVAGPATITGTPTATGTFNFIIRVTLPNGDTTDKEYFLTVAGITNANSLPQATIGTPYTAQLIAQGFQSPQFTISAEPLPDGLQLNPDGSITGTPASDAVKSSFTVFVRDTETNFECNGQATISVANLFDNLAWTQYGNGDYAYIPNSPPNQDNVLISGSDPDSGPGNQAGTQGQFTYTGALLNCNLKVEITFGALGNGGQNHVDFYQDGVNYFSIGPAGLDGLGPGVYNFAFTLPASVASLIQINVNFQNVDFVNSEAIYTFSPAA